MTLKHDFHERCYSLLKKVPKGKVTTYKDIAKALNSKAYRAVGTAMKLNKNAPRIPCHRVIKSNGEVGDYNLGAKRKVELLKQEGIKISNGRIKLSDYIYKY